MFVELESKAKDYLKADSNFFTSYYLSKKKKTKKKKMGNKKSKVGGVGETTTTISQKIEHEPTIFETLPKQLSVYILTYLDVRDLATLCASNSYFNNLIHNNAQYSKMIWKNLIEMEMGKVDEEYFRGSLDLDENNGKICFWREAYKWLTTLKWDVERSGQQIKINSNQKTFMTGKMKTYSKQKKKLKSFYLKENSYVSWWKNFFNFFFFFFFLN